MLEKPLSDTKPEWNEEKERKHEDYMKELAAEQVKKGDNERSLANLEHHEADHDAE